MQSEEMSNKKINVLCMKWGTKYSPEYVNTLYSMVNRNLLRSFRFICLTDDPSGLNEKIETFPIPELSINLSGPERGWNKLSVFSKPLYDIEGRVLCLDLDIIITGSLDELFDHPGDVMIIRDWIKRDGTGNSSVYRFDVGSHADILDRFQNSFDRTKQIHRNEQEFLSAALLEKKALSYWPDSWCKSFKRHCIKPFSFMLARETIIPDDARIIVFHGKPDPHEAMAGKSGKWYRHFRPATWIRDYWR